MAHIPLQGTLFSIFGTILAIFLNVLRNVKNSFDILHKCFHITVMVTKLKNVLGISMLWIFLDIFCPFCTMPQKESETI